MTRRSWQNSERPKTWHSPKMFSKRGLTQHCITPAFINHRVKVFEDHLWPTQNYNVFRELTIHWGINTIFYPGLLSQVYTSEREDWKLSGELGIGLLLIKPIKVNLYVCICSLLRILVIWKYLPRFYQVGTMHLENKYYWFNPVPLLGCLLSIELWAQFGLRVWMSNVI